MHIGLLNGEEVRELSMFEAVDVMKEEVFD